jgi:hypothetical protein
MTNTYREFAEAFTIFARYAGYDGVCAEHDEIWAGPDVSVVSAEDKARLAELGWTDGGEGFGFHRFV